MGIFEREFERDLLGSIIWTKVLTNAGYGLESILHYLSMARFGKVSVWCKEVLIKVRSGIPARDAMRDQRHRIRHGMQDEFYEFVEILSDEGEDMVERLDHLSKTSLNRFENQGESWTKRLGLLLRILELLLVFSFSIYIVDFLNYTLPEGWGGGLGEGIKFTIITLISFSILIVTLLMRLWR